MSPIDSLTDADWEVANWILEGAQVARVEIEATGLVPLRSDETEWEARVDLRDGRSVRNRHRLASLAAFRCVLDAAGMIFAGGE